MYTDRFPATGLDFATINGPGMTATSDATWDTGRILTTGVPTADGFQQLAQSAAASLDLSAGPFTIAHAWQRTNSILTGPQSVIVWGNQLFTTINDTSDNENFELNDPSSNTWDNDLTPGGYPLADAHIVEISTWDPGLNEFKSYRNGTPVPFSDAQTPPINSTLADIGLSNFPSSPTTPNVAKLAGTALWDRVLNAAEITAITNIVGGQAKFLDLTNF